MASGIQTYLNNILNAIYGRDVRNSIHDAIELCYDDVTTGKTVAEAAASNVESAVSAATNAANAANAAATDANTAATAANTAVDDANQAIADVSSVLTNATTAATNATNAANSANTAATSANNAATSANSAASAANKATEDANEAIAIISELDVDTGAAIQAINNANNAATAANNAATNANNAATNANQKAADATSAANDCSIAATAANNAVSSINAARDSANTAATNANDARDDAVTATNDAIRATSAADNAASNANTAASNANAKIEILDSKILDATAATNSANTASSAASIAATNANNARAEIEGMTVDYEDVGPNIPASAILQTVNGHKNIHFLLRQGQSGASFIIKGDAYATLADLQADITEPEVGDQYNVGSAPPYSVYRWTGTVWENQGSIGTSLDQITAQDVAAIQNGREIEGASTKVMRVEALTYLIQNLLADLLSNKVDKVNGKGLSTNDLTSALIEKINSAYNYAQDFVTSKVDAVSGKGLSTNDLTDDLLSKIVLIGSGTLSTTAQNIIGAINELVSGKAPKASPTFTGSPKAPTAGSTDNSTQIATTAFVQGHVSTLNTRIDNITGGTAWAPLDSPEFTGSPTAPTTETSDNSTAIATTAYVKSNISSLSSTYAPKASPAFTGSPTAPTPATTNSSTRIATTAYVQANFTAKSNIYATNVSSGTWTNQGSDATYSDYPYRAALTQGDLANTAISMFAIVNFNPTQVASGNYAPICQSFDGGVYIYSKVSDEIVVPSVAVFR